MNCRVCGEGVHVFIDLGQQPAGNGFLDLKEIREETFFHLQMAFCPRCFLVQQVENLKAEQMFGVGYPFCTGSSKRMVAHFTTWANEIADMQPKSVVELGSNDGTMLEALNQRGVPCLGVEPCSGVRQISLDRGHLVLPDFFSSAFSEEIRKEYGKADVIVAANTFCHIPDIQDAMEGVESLLEKGGVFLFEDAYLGKILELGSFDQWYDEHVYTFGVASVNNLAQRYKLSLIDVQYVPTHGGSMRYTIAHRGTPASSSVAMGLNAERGRGLHGHYPYDKTADEIKQRCKVLYDLLVHVRNQDAGLRRVAGYGATSKSTTLLNFAQIGPELIHCIYDTTPSKVGKYSPGMHIPIRSMEEWKDNPPEYALLLAWNHAEEIQEKERAFQGDWIHYIPEVRIESTLC